MLHILSSQRLKCLVITRQMKVEAAADLRGHHNGLNPEEIEQSDGSSWDFEQTSLDMAPKENVRIRQAADEIDYWAAFSHLEVSVMP